MCQMKHTPLIDVVAFELFTPLKAPSGELNSIRSTTPGNHVLLVDHVMICFYFVKESKCVKLSSNLSIVGYYIFSTVTAGLSMLSHRNFGNFPTY